MFVCFEAVANVAQAGFNPPASLLMTEITGVRATPGFCLFSVDTVSPSLAPGFAVSCHFYLVSFSEHLGTKYRGTQLLGKQPK